MYSLTHKTPQRAPSDVKDEDVNRTNNVIAQLIANSLKYLDRLPTPEVRKTWKENFIPNSEEEWVRLLLMNVFDGCAMTYQGCDSQSLARADRQPSIIAGQPCIQYFAGSMYEGIGCASPDEYSDTDIMNVLKNFIALEETEKPFTPSTVPKLKHNVECNDGKSFNTTSMPQCLQAKQNENTTKKTSNEKFVLIRPSSNSGYVNIIERHDASDLLTIAEALNHGPVIRSTNRENLLAHEFELDNAIAVDCKEWPKDAQKWETRERNSGWPGHGLILQCRNVPCTIVSKSHALNPNDRYEWRFSFTRQEGILLRTLPIEIKMVYIISKVLLKQVVLKGMDLTSYHLKTTFLWFCEYTSTNDFERNELEVNVSNFLHFLVEQLHKHNIPNYFIEQRNMISHINKEKIEQCKTEIECFLSGRLEGVSLVRTAKQYPFCISYIAKDLKKCTLKSTSCLQRLHSNFLSAVMDHLFSLYLPNSHVMWMYFRYIPLLVNKFNKEAETVSITLQEIIRVTGLAFKIYGNDLTKLVTLYCSLVEIYDSEFHDSSRLALDSSFNIQNDPLSSCSCIAHVVNLIAVELGVSATESCCIAIKEWALKNQTEKDIFMITIKNILQTVGSAGVGHNQEHTIACLVAIVNVLEISKNDVEVGMATALRLNSSSENINAISTLCDLIKYADINSVLKQLLYATVLFLEEAEEQNNNAENVKRKISKTKNTDAEIDSRVEGSLKEHAMHEAKKALEAIEKIMKSHLWSTSTDTFRFVVSVIAFQKMTLDSPSMETVKAVLNLIKSSNLSMNMSDIEELQTDMESLLQTKTVDSGNVFQFVVFYTWKCIASSGLPFASSVLDELVKPHFNLGILSAAGLELMTSGQINASIATIELWITRSTGAPVTQNPLLRVKMYGKLGHLYHIKATEAENIEMKTRLVQKSLVMFRTAIKEKVSDITILIDFLLFLWERRHEDFGFYLERACSGDDFSSVSVYHAHSIQLMSNMDDLKREMETKGQIKVSSKVLAHFIAVMHTEKDRENHKDSSEVLCRQEKGRQHVCEMQKCVDILKFIYQQMKHSGSVSSDEIDVLFDTTILLGLAANTLEMHDVALKAFKGALDLCPNHETAKTKVKEISSLLRTSDSNIIYSRT